MQFENKSIEINGQDEFNNKCYRSFFGEDLEEDLDFGENDKYIVGNVNTHRSHYFMSSYH